MLLPKSLEFVKMDKNSILCTYWIFFACFVTYINGLTQGCEYALQTLTCDGVNSTEFPNDILKNTTEINLQNADTNILNTSIFRNCEKLLALSVEYSGVSAIPDNAFSYLKHLGMISLKGNKLTKLQKGIFSGLTSLLELTLSENMLQSVDGLFDGLKSLNKLSLRDNQIEAISTDTFEGLTSLHQLELNNNKIKEIQPGSFENMTMLMFVGLGENPLKSVANVFPSIMMLRYLNMTACVLSSFPTDLPSSLIYLELTKNKIRRISRSDTQQYTTLNALVLERNGLVYIEPGTFTPMVSLRDLFLFVNELEKIPGPFPASLKTIHLDNNRIDSIPPNMFLNNTKLELLSLRINNISSIHPTAFQNLELIKELNLERNTLSVFQDDIFKFANGLKHLNLNRLSLTAIYPDCFSNLNSLTKLEMSFVRVSKDQVHGNIFRNLPRLEELILQESPTLAEIFITNLIIERKKIKTITTLNLEDNGLVSLSYEIQTYLPNIQKLFLRGNRFLCNANLMWLRTWQKIEPDKFERFDKVRCHMPRHLQGQRIEDVKITHFFNQTDSKNNTTDVPFQITDTIYDSGSGSTYNYDDLYNDEFFYSYVDQPNSTIESISSFTLLTNMLQTASTTPLPDEDRVQTKIPAADDSEINDIKTDDKPPPANKNGGNSTNLQTVGIAIGMAFGVIIVMLLVAFLGYKLWSRKRHVAMETSQYQNDGQDYVFIAAPTDRNDKPEPKSHRKMSRAERGSTTSRASEDITNQTDTDMKVYIMDVDA